MEKRTRQIGHCQHEELPAPVEATEFQKTILKEAMKEWLDSAFLTFGIWTFKGLCAAALVGLVYLALVGMGWKR